MKKKVISSFDLLIQSLIISSAGTYSLDNLLKLMSYFKLSNTGPNSSDLLPAVAYFMSADHWIS